MIVCPDVAALNTLFCVNDPSEATLKSVPGPVPLPFKEKVPGELETTVMGKGALGIPFCVITTVPAPAGVLDGNTASICVPEGHGMCLQSQLLSDKRFDKHLNPFFRGHQR